MAHQTTISIANGNSVPKISGTGGSNGNLGYISGGGSGLGISQSPCLVVPVLDKLNYSMDYSLANSGPSLIAQGNLMGLGNNMSNYSTYCPATPFIPTSIAPSNYKYSWEK